MVPILFIQLEWLFHRVQGRNYVQDQQELVGNCLRHFFIAIDFMIDQHFSIFCLN
jgi:hypothetical protein